MRFQVIKMPKTQVDIGSKICTPKETRVDVVPLMDWNTPLDIGEIDTAYEDATENKDAIDDVGDNSAQGQD